MSRSAGQRKRLVQQAQRSGAAAITASEEHPNENSR
jgi:hypothetical protein